MTIIIISVLLATAVTCIVIHFTLPSKFPRLEDNPNIIRPDFSQFNADYDQAVHAWETVEPVLPEDMRADVKGAIFNRIAAKTIAGEYDSHLRS